MPELILPGVYIEVRPEGLIVPGPVSVGNIGIVGTARTGPVGEVKVLSDYAQAREIYGAYDPFENPEVTQQPLSLVRALELAYANGASTVFAVRVTSTEAAGNAEDLIASWSKHTKARQAKHTVAAAGGGDAAKLAAKFHSKQGDGIKITVETVTLPAGHVKVTLKQGSVEEVYTVKDGNDLVAKINAPGTGSAIVTANGGTVKVPDVLATATAFTGGTDANDATDDDYNLGLQQLLNENAHIILAVGKDGGTAINSKLKSHVENASTDKIKRDRIAIIGSALGATPAQMAQPNIASDRLIFVAPGIKTTDAAADAIATAPEDKGKLITLPGFYAAAAVAGMLSARDPHVSLTNKVVSVAGLEKKLAPGDLQQLVQGHVLALEQRNGFRIVKGITTDSGAFRQITTRRIVDFAKFGVRSAAEPYIGLLNNDRVRKALKGSINGFLAGMVDDEMLVSYELDVTATRDEEIRGIAKVIMTVRPTFSIDYIKVVMFLG